MLALLAHLASALVLSPVLPSELPAVAAFFVDAHYSSSEFGSSSPTAAQRLLLERQRLNEMKERFRPVGRYAAPVFDRRLRSSLWAVREGGSIVACAGAEVAVVDSARKLVLRRSRAEEVLRSKLPSQDGAEAARGRVPTGRPVHRELTEEEAVEERLGLLELDARMRGAGSAEAEAAAAALATELDAAFGALPPQCSLSALLSCVAVARSRRRSGLATELCEAVAAQCRPWGRGAAPLPMLAQVEADNEAAAALFGSLGYRERFADTGHVATHAERPSPVFERRELEVLRVPMPLLALERE